MAFPRKSLGIDDLDLMAKLADIEARESFWKYRQRIRPKMIKGWWQRVCAIHLQQFYEDYMAGLRPILVIQAPPQHGKSEQIVDFVSWMAGKNPDMRTIYGSFSERLGIRANRALQRIYGGEVYASVFPDTQICSDNVTTMAGKPLRNQDILEYVGRDGSFRNTTVRGSVTGEGLDLGIIDDPIKGRKEANSEATRNATWDWFTDDFYSRFADNAGLLIILTRWHEDDPVGRMVGEFGDMKVLSYPALASEGAELMPDDPREPGSDEPLFPEHKSKEFLIKRRSLMLPSSWESLYQQNPIPRGDCLINTSRMVVGTPGKIVRKCRYWDKAGTQGGGAFTAGVLVGVDSDGMYWIMDVVRGQWSALERERRIKQCAEVDGRDCPVWIEQEPGSGGKESAEATVRNLAGFKIFAEKVTGDKVTRAEPMVAQIEGGNVGLARGEWNKAFISEAETFPNGKYKDQIDAAGGAFNKLAKPVYSLDNVI